VPPPMTNTSQSSRTVSVSSGICIMSDPEPQ
jgi:hypothetical protein